MVLSSVMLSPWPSIHAGSAATATTRSVSVGRLPGPEHSEHAAECSVQNTLTRPAQAIAGQPVVNCPPGLRWPDTRGSRGSRLKGRLHIFCSFRSTHLQSTVRAATGKELLMYYISLTPSPRYGLRYYHRSHLADDIRQTLKSLCAVAKDSVSHKQ